ncbi:MAG: hypothetical protein FWD68_01375 [Alphaproteobacteria bacterium]|nr:hypothetical protein [Alphaproteobacteria bacterium]
MPTILVILYSILIGYPLLQIASVLAVRSRRRELNRILQELRSNPSYTKKDLELIDRWTCDTSNVVMGVPLPLLAPFMMVYSAWEVLCGKVDYDFASLERDLARERTAVAELQRQGSSKSTIWNDDTFKQANRLSVDIDLGRRPVTIVISLACLMIPVPLVIINFGVRTTINVLTYLFRKVVITHRLFAVGIGPAPRTA